MHLKSLSLRGFKSFAQPTTLDLDPGIICVVGPNGSGKSNIVDALAWVMGEQGAKTLRGTSMADVIFAGTAARPALGRAEVRLTIDNSSGDLPIDYTEVTIARTLFRQGGSEYAINGTPVRLLDIQELLSDTGMGRSMHVIVGQGQLDRVLRADAAERRAFIEEAAGVLKHRRRKERALRKLDQLAEKLDRLEDVTREIGRQLGPLAKQAKIASQAQRIQALERDLRARLLADEAVEQREALAKLEARRVDITAAQQQIAAHMGEAETELAAREAEAGDEEAARAAQEQWRALTGLAESLGSLATIAADRERQLAAPLPAPGGPDLATREQQVDQARRDLAELERAAEAGTARLTEAADAVNEAREAEKKAEAHLVRARQAEAAQVARQRSLEGAEAAARSRADAAAEALQAWQRRLDDAEERAEQTQAAVPELPESEEGRTDAHVAYEAAQEKAREEAARLAAARARVTEATQREATWVSRRDTLALSARPPEATGALLGAGLAGIEGPLAPTLSVESGWEDALGHALGGLVDAAVATGWEQALAALAHAARHDVGRVSLVIADPCGVKTPRPALPDGATWAADVCTSSRDGVDAALDRLLDGVVLAHTLAEAHAVRDAAGVRAVWTDRGECVYPLAATGGSDEAVTVLALQAECDLASEEADAAASERIAAEADLEAAHDLARAAEKAAATALAALRAADAKRAREAEARARARAAAASAAAEVERARSQCERASADAATRAQAAAEAEAALAAFAASASVVDVSEADDAARAAREHTRRVTDAFTEVRLHHSATEQRLATARATLSRAEADIDRFLRRTRQLAADEERRTRQRALAAHIAEQAGRGARLAARAAEVARERQRVAEEERRSLSARVSEVRRALDGHRVRLGELTEALHRDEVAAAQYTLRLDQVAEQAEGSLGLALETLIADFGPHNLVPDVDDPDSAGVPYVRAEVASRLTRAERDLKALGKVNPLALEEHRALEERYRFMTTQLGDVKSSRADLMRVIAEVDEQVERAFVAAYDDTQAAFGEVVDTLFPGGEGRLVLTHPDSPLETGVDLEVRPAGKRVKRLSLLSGGERSLAAMAYLFAIFKARPSPFYILDEVEAALDDANLTRMLTVFEQLREVSQLIIITHQKRTMEVANALYGVTMKDGVSTVVAHRLAGHSTKR